MNKANELIPVERIQNFIFLVRKFCLLNNLPDFTEFR